MSRRTNLGLQLLASMSAAAFLLLSAPARAQSTSDSSAHSQHGKSQAKKPEAGDKSLAQQIEDLKRQVAELQAAARQNAPRSPEQTASTRRKARGGLGMMGKTPGSESGMTMAPMSAAKGGMSGGPSMPMEGGKEPMPGAMSEGMEGEMSGSMPMESEMSGSMPKEMQGQMPMKPGGEMGSEMMGMGSMEPPMPASALPGFPGASHVYHVGSTGFYLDYADRLGLSNEQQARLNRIREHSLMQQDEMQRQIAKAEEELWSLTASDQPDSAKIETRTREIERLRADQRLSFIRNVGEAAGVLTDEQRNRVLGAPMKAPADQPKMKM